MSESIEFGVSSIDPKHKREILQFHCAFFLPEESFIHFIQSCTCFLFNADFYLPPTKLRKDNVFSRVCLSFCSQEEESLYWALALTVPDMFNLVHYKACTVDKRAVGIRLKCLMYIYHMVFVWSKYINCKMLAFFWIASHRMNDINSNIQDIYPCC